ncbi:MAG: Sugar phosphatase YidA [bacterium ADurb.Bin429]|nr:MAG: Sugar phosphatase YidA [bacterium ADurb.Bin429]
MSSLPYELIALDLDLTFLDDAHQISPRNRAAVLRCAEMGAKVVLSSGRMYRCTLPYLHLLGLDAPLITYNGAFIKQESTGEVWLDEHLDLGVAREIVDFCAARDLNLNYYLDDNLYVAKINPWAELYSARTTAPLNPVGDLRTLTDRAPTKVLIVADPGCIAELYVEMSATYGDRAYVTISNVEYLEFMPKGVDKGKALHAVADHCGIPHAKTIAFGDAGNDIPLIRAAGLGVAMENAKPEAKAVAGRIAPPYDEDGVAAVLEELFGFTPASAG